MKNVTIEKVSRLPLEKSNTPYIELNYLADYFQIDTPLPLLLIPLSAQPEAFLLVTVRSKVIYSSFFKN
jgi:hypothetical protein